MLLRNVHSVPAPVRNNGARYTRSGERVGGAAAAMSRRETCPSRTRRGVVRDFRSEARELEVWGFVAQAPFHGARGRT